MTSVWKLLALFLTVCSSCPDVPPSPPAVPATLGRWTRLPFKSTSSNRGRGLRCWCLVGLMKRWTFAPRTFFTLGRRGNQLWLFPQKPGFMEGTAYVSSAHMSARPSFYFYTLEPLKVRTHQRRREDWEVLAGPHRPSRTLKDGQTGWLVSRPGLV